MYNKMNKARSFGLLFWSCGQAHNFSQKGLHNCWSGPACVHAWHIVYTIKRNKIVQNDVVKIQQNDNVRVGV